MAAFDSGAFDSGAFDTGGIGNVTLIPGIYVNANIFYTQTISPGAVTLTPPIVSNTNTFYTAAITTGGATQSLTAALFTNTNTLYSASVTRGTVNLAPPITSNTNTFYAVTLTGGAVSLTAPITTNSNTFYTPSVARGAVSLAVPAVSNTNILYGPVVDEGSVTIVTGLLVNPQSFYGVALQAQIGLVASNALNTSAFYSATIIAPGAGQTVSAPLVGNNNQFYAANLSNGGESTGFITNGSTTRPSKKFRPSILIQFEDEEVEESFSASISLAAISCQSYLLELDVVGEIVVNARITMDFTQISSYLKPVSARSSWNDPSDEELLMMADLLLD